MSNSVENIGIADEIYRYDERQQKDILAAKPWEKEWETTAYHNQLSTCGSKVTRINELQIFFLHESVWHYITNNTFRLNGRIAFSSKVKTLNTMENESLQVQVIKTFLYRADYF